MHTSPKKQSISRAQSVVPGSPKRPINSRGSLRTQSAMGMYSTTSKSNSPRLSNITQQSNLSHHSPSTFMKRHQSKLPGSANVKAVVRVRPFLPREIEKNAPNLITMDPSTNSTTIHPPPSQENTSHLGQFSSRSSMRRNLEPKTFTFDHSFYSSDPSSPDFADQDAIYEKVGKEFLDHNFEGYHTCIFAYGQTGSGKSYTMMGSKSNPGLIPRTCRDLFERIENQTSANVQYTVRVSYFEVYNEQVRDLLLSSSSSSPNSAGNKGSHRLKVRESPTEGPYVEDLSEFTVKTATDVLKYLELGNKNRVVASTKMNDVSSRSHAVFTLVVKQVISDPVTDATEEKTARIRLVDLAGSERAVATGATGQRLREGGNINKSLTTLGRVIAALAGDGGNGSSNSSGNNHETVVPYRDSVLTWLLKDSLGGNSKTAMVACISPTDYDETLSTLRYADQAKNIKTRAVVNQDVVSAADRDKLLAEMQAQINMLQMSLVQSENNNKANNGSNEKEIDEEEQERYTREQEQRKIELEKVKKAIRFYEDKANTEETKRRAIQVENEAVKRHNKLLIEHLKEVTNKTVGSQYIFADEDAVEGPHDYRSSGPAGCDDGDDSDEENQGLRSDYRKSNVTQFSDMTLCDPRISYGASTAIPSCQVITYSILEQEYNDLLKDLAQMKENVRADAQLFRQQIGHLGTEQVVPLEYQLREVY